MSQVIPDLNKLQQKLGYEFSDISWLKLALTHRSKSKLNYERLEFLGDSFLGFVISDCLYKQFPKEPEGVLTRLRASIVRQKSLAIVAREFGFSEFLILGAGEGRSGGHGRDSTLSDVLEAVIAAIYMDGGTQQARDFIERTFADKLGSLDPSVQLKDPKSQLQEWLQKLGYEVPDYQVIKVSGKDHDQIFDVECATVMTAEIYRGQGSSRRIAEQKAAKNAMASLKLLKKVKAK